MNRIRVLVVEDSVTVRKRLLEVLSADPEIHVVGDAADGKAAIELCRKLHPDVVTVDMQLPVLSGLAVTEHIMAFCPTPILIVSSSFNRGEIYKTYDALAAGAVDILDKPKGDETDDAWERKFLTTVKLVSRIQVITHMRGRLKTALRMDPEPRIVEPAYRAVAIGASTGGPAAVAAILQDLPPNFPLPILVVIHILETFDRFLAEWLDSHSPLRVSCAVDGEPLPEGGQARVILAPPARHLVVSGNRMRLTDQVERHSCKPSVDVLFESMARELGRQSIACLLTGIGRDGARGLLAIRDAGGRTLAQDEATSTIFGMPREAIRMGGAERVIGLHEFAPALVALAGGGDGALSLGRAELRRIRSISRPGRPG